MHSFMLETPFRCGDPGSAKVYAELMQEVCSTAVYCRTTSAPSKTAEMAAKLEVSDEAAPVYAGPV